MSETLYTLKEVAKLLRVNPRTLIENDKMPPYFWVGNRRRWRASDIEAWIKEQIEPVNPIL